MAVGAPSIVLRGSSGRRHPQLEIAGAVEAWSFRGLLRSFSK